ncbi:glutathione S-transferase family protein [Dongia deserti]|uniref:glutathione S-transferase family protein n=1 Tax=Dongia deserti TaxID=2268030 RepID=UPI000E656958|nr:glutathione S-transferase family protein [Dongia deserti]
MLRLLGRNTSGNVQKVIFLLEELGAPYTREDYGRQFNNTQDAAYLKLNPNGKVPTLVDGDVVVWESNTILRYVCNKLNNTALYPADPAARTEVERWMDWLLASVNYHYVAVFKDSKKPANERAATFEADAKELAAQLSILDGAMAGRKWIAGSNFALTDIALGPILHRCLDFPIALPALSNLKAWREKLKERPAFKKATGA